jgi:hypothetical protein
MAEAVNIPIAKLALNTGQIEGLPKNPRFIRDDRFAKLVQSIKDDPEMMALRELLAYPTGKEFVVIGGNMRLRALKELGYKEAPCKVLDKATPVEKLRAYTIKDNIGFGDHDWDGLANEWDAGELSDWGLDAALDPIDLREVDEQATDSMKIVIHCKDQAEYDDMVRRLGKSPSAELIKSMMS